MQKWVRQGVPGGSKSKAPKQKNCGGSLRTSIRPAVGGQTGYPRAFRVRVRSCSGVSRSPEGFQQGSDRVRGGGVGCGEEAGEGGLDRERASGWCLSKRFTLTDSGRDLR